ncbi:MAG: hypothetical protein WBP29_11070 [Candidatus Zixiibacteriota bacterium]
MKIGDIVISLGISLVILFASIALSRRQTPPQTYTTQSGELTLTHTAPQLIVGKDVPARLDVEVTGGLLPDSATLFVYLRPTESAADTAFKRAPMLTIIGEGLIYRRDLTNSGIGKNFEYFIQLIAPSDSTFADTVLATIPAERQTNPKSLLTVRFEGSAPKSLLYSHVALMFAAFCLMILAVLSSMTYPKDPGALTRAGRMSVLVVLLLLIGVFGIGAKIELVMYGSSWSGVPVGGNLTDTASAILLLYWAVVVLILRKQIVSAESSEELITQRVQILLIIGAALAAVCYLIPHGAGRV